MTDRPYSQHFEPVPVDRGPAGKTTTGVPADPPQAVLDVRQVVEDLKVITAGLWTTIAAYEHQLADGYPTSVPGGDHPREHGEPTPPSECSECGWIGPCPEHGPADGTATERAALNRDARKLHELNRRMANLRVSAADARSYLEMIRRHLGGPHRSDTERKSSLCGIPGCDLDALTDLHGRKIVVLCADGVERQLCDTHHREATRCALCDRKAEVQPTGKVKLHSVIVNGVHQQLQLCTTCRLEARQAS